MKSFLGLVTLVGLLSWGAWPAAMAMATSSEEEPMTLAKRMAKTSMEDWAVTGPAKDRFQYELGVFLRGIELVYERTHERRYLDYIKFKVDRHVADNGTIAYNATQLTLDDILTGRLVLTLFQATDQAKYKTAAKQLIAQLEVQPRTNAGGFWHKLIYPYQMWLDGLYMAQPFVAEYAKQFQRPRFFRDVAKQFILMEKVSRDAKTGLLYHGYDESREQKWADPTTGRSASFWGRAVGWYFMGIIDTLEFFPLYHPKRDELLAITKRLAKAVAKVQDAQSGLWWQVLDQPGRKGNYLESSCSAMFVYSYARAVRLGYLPKEYLRVAKKGYAGMVRDFVVLTPDGGMNYTQIASVGGLGGSPVYRNGTLGYYISEPIVANDPKGVGPFMMWAARGCDKERCMKIARDSDVIIASLLPHFFAGSERVEGDGGAGTTRVITLGPAITGAGVERRNKERVVEYDEAGGTMAWELVDDPRYSKLLTSMKVVECDNGADCIIHWQMEYEPRDAETLPPEDIKMLHLQASKAIQSYADQHLDWP